MHRRQPALALSGVALAFGLAAAIVATRPAAAQPASAQPGVVPPAARVAAPPVPDVADDNGDPWEDANRSIFGFNQWVDKYALVPAASAYRAAFPQPIRDSLRDVLQNVNSPLIFANDLLQGRFDLAGDTLGRFLINSTVGFGGLVDVATKVGVVYHTNDLGITMATWGVGSGPYLMVPVLGPMNPRDLGGQVAESFGDPANIAASNANKIWISFTRGAASGIDERSRNIESLAEIERTSLDYYATIRSLARQRRAAQIRHQREDMPNATPLLGSNGTSPSPATEAVAELPKPVYPAIDYRLAPNQPGVAMPRTPAVPGK